ncbi:hypothetical protein OHA21_11305 [Actinoplanes sp. NBC_00393]|uniref:hypothetical protein n=1 Tax=Actinoplanes sp. NBC_00393 TaxID=2975953 RepID=UPI002E210988
MATTAEVRSTLRDLQRHPHDHGWHPFYAVLDSLFAAEEKAGHGPLTRITETCYENRPSLTVSHFVTLLCIALKEMSGDWRNAPVFDRTLPVEQRAEVLRDEIDDNRKTILERVLTRQNSFSSARRFLIPQVLISHFAARTRMSVRLADLGTGAGLLPRQLNSRSNYERFAPGLTWQGWEPSFVEVDYAERWGVDRTPVEDKAWIRHCYGPSAYYDERYEELAWAFDQPEVLDAKLHMADVDLLGPDKLARFLRENRFNVVTCSFVLYQYEQAARETIIAAVVGALPPQGLFVSLEPTGDLLTPGAAIRAYHPGDATPLDIGEVSDGHCIGKVTAGSDFDAFRRDFL